MKNSSNKHRRRLHIIQNEQTRSEIAAAEHELDLSVPVNDAPAQENSDSPTSVSIANNPKSPGKLKTTRKSKSSRANTAPASLIKAQQTLGSPLTRRRYLMDFLRHILMVTILAAFGYLYTQSQKTDHTTTNNDTAEVDPFSNWNQAAEAPAFNAMNVSQSGGEIPMSISLTDSKPNQSTTDNLGLPINQSQWIESTKNQIQKSSDQPNHSSVSQTKSQSSIDLSKTKNNSFSLWNEPKQKQNKQTESIASHTRREIADLQAMQQKQQQQKQITKKLITKNDIKVAPKKTEQTKKQPVVAQPNQQPTVPVTVEAWRQFTLGSGPKCTVCVIDETVTGDALLLSTIFTGVRRKWMSEVDRSQKQRLVFLIANTKQKKGLQKHGFSETTLTLQQKRSELQRKIEASTPDRIVYLNRGHDSRGWIRFSSEQESIDALMSVPGKYRIAPLKLAEYLNAKNKTTNSQKVQIELPAQAQESSTVDLLFTAMSGEWNNQLQANSIDYQANPISKKSTETIPEKVKTPSSNNKNSVKKSCVEILPSPAEFLQQANRQIKPVRNTFFKLPAPPVQAGK